MWRLLITFPLSKDTMENWDETKLEEVINKKHGEAEKKKAKTSIVSVLIRGRRAGKAIMWCPSTASTTFPHHTVNVLLFLEFEDVGHMFGAAWISHCKLEWVPRARRKTWKWWGERSRVSDGTLSHHSYRYPLHAYMQTHTILGKVHAIIPCMLWCISKAFPHKKCLTRQNQIKYH